MKLSEAMLLGSISNGQAFGTLHDERGNTCAMGAAMTAAGEVIEPSNSGLIKRFSHGHNDTIAMWKRTRNRWPILKTIVAHPVANHGTGDVWTVIVNLNNKHRWTRPQIAAWVAEQEAIFCKEGESCTGRVTSDCSPSSCSVS